MVFIVDTPAAQQQQQQQNSSTQQALENLADTSDRSRQKRKVSQIPLNGRNARSESLKKTRVGLSNQQEYELNKDVLLRYGMDAEKQKKMEEGFNLNEIVNKQRAWIRKGAEIEQIKENARKNNMQK